MDRGAPRSESKSFMLAGGKHTEINREAGPYKGAIDYLKQLDKSEFEAFC